ncbi:MAG: EamA family transporter [Pseudomonadota bacterium]
MVEPLVFAAVLAAAAMHAGWNALAKRGLEPARAVTLIAIATSLAALPLLPWVALPRGELWLWIVGSAVLHTAYKLALIEAYSAGELGQVYPIARGTAPLIVALVGVLWLGETLAPELFAGVLVLSFGVILMALKGSGPRPEPAAIGYALATACAIAAYTLVDGHGARRAPSAASFALYLFVIDGAMIAAVFLARWGPREMIGLARHWRHGLIGGTLSLGAYWVAIWAMTQAPIAAVAALRETSVLFALLLSRVLLGERLGLGRLGAALMILAGAVLVRA